MNDVVCRYLFFQVTLLISREPYLKVSAVKFLFSALTKFVSLCWLHFSFLVLLLSLSCDWICFYFCLRFRIFFLYTSNIFFLFTVFLFCSAFYSLCSEIVWVSCGWGRNSIATFRPTEWVMCCTEDSFPFWQPLWYTDALGGVLGWWTDLWMLYERLSSRIWRADCVVEAAIKDRAFRLKRFMRPMTPWSGLPFFGGSMRFLTISRRVILAGD